MADGRDITPRSLISTQIPGARPYDVAQRVLDKLEAGGYVVVEQAALAAALAIVEEHTLEHALAKPGNVVVGAANMRASEVLKAIRPDRVEEIVAGCTCTPTTGRQDDYPVHYDHAYDVELAERTTNGDDRQL